MVFLRKQLYLGLLILGVRFHTLIWLSRINFKRKFAPLKMNRLFITYCFITALVFSSSHKTQFSKYELDDTQLQFSVSIHEEGYSIPTTIREVDSTIDLLGPQYSLYINKIPTIGFCEEPKTLNENYRRAQSLLSSTLKI